MADLKKLTKEIMERNPELKEMYERDEKYKEERKQYYLDQGFDENVAKMKAWEDFWQKAYDEYGAEVSIHEIKK